MPIEDLIDLIALETLFALTLLSITALAIVLMRRFFGVKWLNGLWFAQAKLFFNV